VHLLIHIANLYFYALVCFVTVAFYFRQFVIARFIECSTNL